jgi:hypothetical protein
MLRAVPPSLSALLCAIEWEAFFSFAMVHLCVAPPVFEAGRSRPFSRNEAGL